MRYYRVTIDLKAADWTTKASVEEEVEKVVGDYYTGLTVFKTQAELITPSQAGEKKP